MLRAGSAEIGIVSGCQGSFLNADRTAWSQGFFRGPLGPPAGACLFARSGRLSSGVVNGASAAAPTSPILDARVSDRLACDVLERFDE